MCVWERECLKQRLAAVVGGFSGLDFPLKPLPTVGQEKRCGLAPGAGMRAWENLLIPFLHILTWGIDVQRWKDLIRKKDRAMWIVFLFFCFFLITFHQKVKVEKSLSVSREKVRLCMCFGFHFSVSGSALAGFPAPALGQEACWREESTADCLSRQLCLV